MQNSHSAFFADSLPTCRTQRLAARSSKPSNLSARKAATRSIGVCALGAAVGDSVKVQLGSGQELWWHRRTTTEHECGTASQNWALCCFENCRSVHALTFLMSSAVQHYTPSPAASR